MPEALTGETLKIFKKYQAKYYVLSWSNAVLYWTTRLTVVIGGVLLPFVLKDETWARNLSLAIAVAAALDIVYSPAKFWKIFSNACDRLRDFKMLHDSCDPELGHIINDTESQTHNPDDLKVALEKAQELVRAATAGLSNPRKDS